MSRSWTSMEPRMESAIDEIERQQSAVGKFNLGLPLNAPNISASSILGIKPFRELLYTAQLKYLLRLFNQDSRRVMDQNGAKVAIKEYLKRGAGFSALAEAWLYTWGRRWKCIMSVWYMPNISFSTPGLEMNFHLLSDRSSSEVAIRAFLPDLFPQPGKKWRELSGHGITEEYDWSICADIFLTSELLHPGHELSKHGQTEEKTEDCPWGTSFNLMSRWTWTNITSGTRRIELFHMCDKIVFMHCIPANTKPQSRVKSWLCLKSI